ncbi:hypothetical protein PLEOSDRAFT_1096294 [Pleurotus ostreatus PC15]|uniref:Glycosyltransferase family 61 protein n=1 Tax=Pleurotus ostreatus (strain PC15) TaxID=1137138 RepID=A0A067NWX0_PLEO1|nr:hypothetical protein PLEOSDRAFT_1096294 [Pleurotus ostreatus PC15]
MPSLILHWRYRLLGGLITTLLTLSLYQFATRHLLLLSAPVVHQHHEHHLRAFPTTEFLAHAPGFSVIQNLFWRNGTFYFVTDQPWHIPPIAQVVSLSTDRTRKFDDGRVAAKIKAIRLPPVSPEVKEQNQIGETISLEDAEREFGAAEVIEGPMLRHTTSIKDYHWIGEMFLGVWRVWHHHGWRTGVQLPEIRRIAYTKQYSKADAPPGAKPGRDFFNDAPGANVWFIDKFFPGIQWDTKTTWDARAAANKTYRITTAILGDRSAGHAGPSSAYKPFGDVLRLPVPPDWLAGLKARILGEYHGPTPLSMPNRPLILVGVHGNGLTHSLWMTPTRLSAVFEFQPQACTITDYSPLATAAGIAHYLVHETDFCRPLECPKRGCAGPVGLGLINGVVRLDPGVVTGEIRRMLAVAVDG